MAAWLCALLVKLYVAAICWIFRVIASLQTKSRFFVCLFFNNFITCVLNNINIFLYRYYLRSNRYFRERPQSQQAPHCADKRIPFTTKHLSVSIR